MSNLDLATITASRTVALMQSRDMSPVELTSDLLERIDEVNPTLNAVVTVDRDRVLADAHAAEKKYRDNTSKSLEGLPLTIKDTIDTAGIRTTAGSRLLALNVPTVNSPAVDRLVGAGAIILAKTNTPEFAMTFSTDNDLFGRTANPAQPHASPGGSSGGEAAVIAAQGSLAGLGSDLAGSIRIPAAFCGVYGFRPTVGRVPSTGHIPALPDPLGPLSVIGPMARAVEDIDLLMSALASDWSRPDTGIGATPRLKVGILAGLRDIPIDSSIRDAIDEAARVLGHEISTESISIPSLDELIEVWNQLWAALGGAKGLLSNYVTADDYSALSPALRRQIESSPEGNPELVAHIWRRIGVLRQNVLAEMRPFAAIICPVAAGPATDRPGQWDIDGVHIRGLRGFAYSYIWSLLGCPALSMPFQGSNIQIVGTPGDDEVIISIASTIENRQIGDSEP